MSIELIPEPNVLGVNDKHALVRTRFSSSGIVQRRVILRIDIQLPLPRLIEKIPYTNRTLRRAPPPTLTSTLPKLPLPLTIPQKVPELTRI